MFSKRFLSILVGCLLLFSVPCFSDSYYKITEEQMIEMVTLKENYKTLEKNYQKIIEDYKIQQENLEQIQNDLKTSSIQLKKQNLMSNILVGSSSLLIGITAGLIIGGLCEKN